MSRGCGRSLWADRSGSVAIKFAVLVPVLFGAAAAALGYSSLSARRTELQGAADSAALAAVRELSLANHDGSSVDSAARSVVLSIVKNPGGLNVTGRALDANSVEVRIRETIATVMGRFLNASSADVAVSSVARITSTKICLLALEPQKPQAVSLNKSARLTATQCSIFSNSTAANGIKAADNAQVEAELVCSAGGIDGKKGHFSQPP